MTNIHDRRKPHEKINGKGFVVCLLRSHPHDHYCLFSVENSDETANILANTGACPDVVSAWFRVTPPLIRAIDQMAIVGKAIAVEWYEPRTRETFNLDITKLLGVGRVAIAKEDAR